MNSFYENWVTYQKDPAKARPQNNTVAKFISKKSKKTGEQRS